jgi:predicted Zn-dependent protease
MRKLIFSLLVSAFAISAGAQDIDKIKGFVILQKFKDAKTEIDKAMSNAKFSAKPEAHILKSTVYLTLAGDKEFAAQSGALFQDALTSFNKYKEMDKTLTLVKEQPYNSVPGTFYSTYYNEGIGFFNKKEWESALPKFASAVEMSDFIINNKLVPNFFDTSGLLLAGATAQNLKTKDAEAAAYFSRLADQRVGGADNEFLHQFLTMYYLNSGNTANFAKYKKIGSELYPKSEFFKYEEMDFILSMTNKKKKMELIDEKLKADPTNPKLQGLIGEIYFDQLNSHDSNAVRPANFDELEAKMIEAFNKATELKPTSGIPTTNIAKHFLNKAVKINAELEAHNKAVRERLRVANAPVNGKPPAKLKGATPEENAKKDAINARYYKEIDNSIGYFEKAIAIFQKAGDLPKEEKSEYKRSVSYLVDFYNEKKQYAKGKPAEAAKYEALQKKWQTLYDTKF